ncbi:MAG: hypothetical protein ACAI34_23060 [Verrucomicrobium sp.]|nr:hypothetical protein [Verrucomicrobium sp.]
MKQSVAKILTVLFITIGSSFAAPAEGPLPFPVTVGSQDATHKAGEPFAKVEKPVTSDAALSVGVKADMAIINVHKLKADGTTDETAQPAIIIFHGTDKGTLAQTMDKQKLPAGKYLLSITAGEATATIQIEIQ